MMQARARASAESCRNGDRQNDVPETKYQNDGFTRLQVSRQDSYLYLISSNAMMSTGNCPASDNSSRSRRRSRPSAVGCASAICATGGGGLNDENIPSNHDNANAIPHQRPMTNENDEAMEVGAADCALDLAGTIDGLLRASILPANAAGADPLFHSSRNLSISSALSKESRSKSIAAAHRMFHHDDVVAHDDEVRSGAFDALVFRLGLSVGLMAASSSVSGKVEVGNNEQGNPSRQDEDWSELAQIVSTLSQVCRCSHSYRLATFHCAARDQLLPLLFHVMCRGREVLGESTIPSIAKNASEVIVGSLGVLRSYSKVADIRPQLLKPAITEQLLPCLAGLLLLCARKKSIVDRSVRIKIEKDALGLLKDVTHRCSENEARLLVVDRPAVLKAALEIGNLAKRGTEGRATSHRHRNDEYLATVLWNCASHRSVRAALLSLGKEGCSSSSSSSNDTSSILSFLSSVLSFDSGRQHGANYAEDDGDDDFELQKAALSCLGNLCRGMQDAAAEGMDAGRFVLAHDEGIFVERLLSIATHAPASSSLVCRRRAVRTIRCLVGATGGGKNADNGKNSASALLGIASQRGIDVLGQLSNIMTNDDDENVQIHAAESVATLYHLLNEDQTIAMLNSSFICVITSTTKNAKCAEISCRCLSSASAIIDLNKQSDLFPSLLGIVRLHESDSNETHKLKLSSLKLIRVLSTVKTNRPVMLREEGRICSDTGDNEISFGLLNCLSLILKRSGKDYGCGAIGAIEMADLQKEAAAILVELSRDDSAQSIVDYPDLLSSFTNYCTNTVGPSGPERNEAKKALMRLVAML